MALPKFTQASNLLVVGAPSASHVGFSTFRMEPAFMILGTSVGVWAALAAEAVNTTGAVHNSPDSPRASGNVHDVPLAELRAALEAAGQVLKIPPKPPTPP
jgi:hypothetical protein